MTDEHFQKLKNYVEQLRGIAQTPGIFASPADSVFFSIRKDIPEGLHIEDFPTQVQIITAAKQNLFQVDQAHRLWLNPIAIGQIIASLDAIIAEEKVPSSWHCVHPRIKKSSMKLYLDGHYANAAEDAFIEINDAVKEQYKKLHVGEEPPDGVDLMHKVFGGHEITLADIGTETGKNIQQGFHFLFAGSISAFRNPKAHSKKETISAGESMRRIMFASSLMYKLDEISKEKQPDSRCFE